MKRERRQELKENALAEFLGKWITRLAPYSQRIAIVVLAIVIIYAAWGIWSRWATAREQGAWEAVYSAMESGTAADYEAVAEQFPQTKAGYWSRLLAADIRLQIACNSIMTNKPDAAQELRKALDHYLALRNVSVSPFFEQRVLWGLARTYEALAATKEGQGELERAIKLYQELVDRFPDGPFSDVARRRLASLNKNETRQLYDFLAAYEPSKVQPPLSQNNNESGSPSTLLPSVSPQAGQVSGPSQGLPDTTGPAQASVSTPDLKSTPASEVNADKVKDLAPVQSQTELSLGTDQSPPAESTSPQSPSAEQATPQPGESKSQP